MKKNYTFIIKFVMISAFLVIIIQINALAQFSDGGYSEPWLSRNVGARPMAMAGVYTAIVNEPAGIFYNPAGSGFMADAPSFSSSVSSLGFGRTSASLAWAQELIPHLGVGAGVNNLYSGSFMSRNIKGEPIQEVNNNQIAALLSASYRLEFISMGASFKYLNNTLNNSKYSASGTSFDLGIKLNVLDYFSFGVAMNNIGGSMKWNTSSQISEKIPYSIRTGVAFEFGLNEETQIMRTSITGEEMTVTIPPSRYILVGMDAVMNQYDKAPSWILGTEVVAHEVFVIRGGLSLYGDKDGEPQILPMNNWGTGFSIRPQITDDFILHIDYSLTNEYLDNSRISHHISMILEF